MGNNERESYSTSVYNCYKKFICRWYHTHGKGKGKGKGHSMTCLCRHRWEREVQLEPICILGARRGWAVITSPDLFTHSKDPVSIVQEAGWASGLVCMGMENLASTGIRSPNCPACSESLYRLRCPGRNCTNGRHRNYERMSNSKPVGKTGTVLTS